MVGLQPQLHLIGAFLRNQDTIGLQRAQEKEEEASKRRKVQRKSPQKRVTEQEGVFTLQVGSELCHHLQ